MGRASQNANVFAGHLADPHDSFGIVSCMRDPVARLISHAFKIELEVLGQTGRSIVESADSFIE